MFACCDVLPPWWLHVDCGWQGIIRIRQCDSTCHALGYFAPPTGSGSHSIYPVAPMFIISLTNINPVSVSYFHYLISEKFRSPHQSKLVLHYFDFAADPLPFLTFSTICDIFCLDCSPNNVAGLSHLQSIISESASVTCCPALILEIEREIPDRYWSPIIISLLLLVMMNIVIILLGVLAFCSAMPPPPKHSFEKRLHRVD